MRFHPSRLMLASKYNVTLNTVQCPVKCPEEKQCEPLAERFNAMRILISSESTLETRRWSCPCVFEEQVMWLHDDMHTQFR